MKNSLIAYDFGSQGEITSAERKVQRDHQVKIANTFDESNRFDVKA